MKKIVTEAPVTPEEKVIWESEAKNADGRSYMTVKQNGNYIYSERLGTDSVAFVLYNEKSDKPFGLVKERKPPLDVRFNDTNAMLSTAFGGSNDIDASLDEIVQAECREEAGYRVEMDAIKRVMTTMVSTQSNQLCHLYMVDVTDYELGEKEPETEMEALATTEWFDFDGIIENSDWKSISIVSASIMKSQKA